MYRYSYSIGQRQAVTGGPSSRPVASNPRFFAPKGVADPYCEVQIGQHLARFAFRPKSDLFHMLSDEYQTSSGARRKRVRVTNLEMQDLLDTVLSSAGGKDTAGPLAQLAEIVKSASAKRQKLSAEFPLNPNWLSAHLRELANAVRTDQDFLRPLSASEKRAIGELTKEPDIRMMTVHKHEHPQESYDDRRPPGEIASDYKRIPWDEDRGTWA